MKAVNDFRIRLAGILILTAMRFGFTSSDALAGNIPATWQYFRFNLILSFLSAILIWEFNRAVVVYFHRAYPLSRSGGRFALEALIVCFVNTLIYAGSIAVLMKIDPASRPHWIYLMFGVADRFLYGMLVAGFYELFFFMNAWQTANREAEQLKKVNLMIQFESLRTQVQPHFLFNSLNTLTGLVEKDPPQAVRFIAELSTVYRYLLQSHEKQLITLGEELQFTKAYFFLLQTRFGEGISISILVDEEYQNLLLPPLTLQMLVENAVKHNQVSPRKPLTITVRVEEASRLTIGNNVQPKRNAASTGTGLSNIAARYRLLNEPELIIVHDEKQFIIKVPLIKPSVA